MTLRAKSRCGFYLPALRLRVGSAPRRALRLGTTIPPERGAEQTQAGVTTITQKQREKIGEDRTLGV